MATGTATLSDSYWLGQSTVLKNRVQVALVIYCNVIQNEGSGVTGHTLRKQQVWNILGNMSFWLNVYVMFAAYDANLVAAATQASTNYTPINTPNDGDVAAADGQSPLITTTLISNAIAAAFNTSVSGL